MSVSTIIHVGIVKAASTTLQEHLFARHSGLHHVGGPWRSQALAVGFGNLTATEVYDFDACGLRALCAAELDAAAGAGRVASFSAEAFTICDRANRVMTAERLREVCGPAKIVAVLRNQIDWLSSRYVHNYVKSIPETRLDFDDWLYSHWKRDTFSYRHHADFDTMLRVYGDVFGMENVHVLLLEDLIADKHDFVSRLCTIMGVDADEGIKLLATAHNEKRGSRLGYLRRRFGLLPDVAFSPMVPKPLYDAVTAMAGGKMDPVFTDAWRHEVEDYYRTGNRRVAERFGIDLGARGYAV
jgi:hypothetical protein